MDITGDHVLVTGGCGDFGLGIARAILEPGKALATGYKRNSLVELDLADGDAVETRLCPFAQLPDAPDFLINGVGWMPKTSPESKPWTT